MMKKLKFRPKKLVGIVLAIFYCNPLFAADYVYDYDNPSNSNITLTNNQIVLDNSSNNTLTIKSTDSSKSLFHVKVLNSPEATKNSVIIENAYRITGGIHGGYAKGRNATLVSDNKVHFKNGTAHTIYGGEGTDSAIVKNNQVIFDNGKAVLIFGGYSKNADIEGNTVTINGGAFDDSHPQYAPGKDGSYAISGGHSLNGDSKGNHVTINDGVIRAYVYGGYSYNGKNASNNTVTIKGGTFNNVAGGGTFFITGGKSHFGNSTGNIVTIEKGTIAQPIYGGFSQLGTVDNNTVKINGGVINRSISGGYGGQNATNNNIIINNGSMASHVIGGVSENGNSTNNTVTINNGTINGLTVGGNSNNPAAQITDNTVTITGGNFKRSVYGAHVENGTSNPFTGTMTNNTVNILGKATFDTNNSYIGGSNMSNQVSGNTLNLAAKDIQAKGIINFEYLNFYLPADIQAGDTMISVQNNVDLTNAKIGVAAVNGVRLNEGDSVTFISTQGTLTVPTDLSNHINDPANTRKLTSLTLDTQYQFEILKDNNRLVNRVDKVQDNQGQKNLLETGIAQFASIYQNSEMIDSLSSQIANTIEPDATLGTFATMQASSMRYESGSHVDGKHFGLVAGISHKVNNSFTYGILAELGIGSYDSYNQIGSNNYHGSGNTKHYGVGVMSRYQFNNRWYLTNSLHMGRLRSDYTSRDFGAETVNFDSSKPYFAAHVGLGNVIPLTERSNVDVYSKLHYARLGSEDITLNNNRFHFDTIHSTRAKLGAQYNYNLNTNSNIYVDLALEREFNSTVGGKNLTTNYQIEEPSLKGNTAIGTIGYRFKTANNQHGQFIFDGYVRGLTGKKDSIDGGVTVKWQY